MRNSSPVPPVRVETPESRAPLLVVLWITLSVIGFSFFSTNPTIETYVRPLFFLGLSVFFVALGRTQPGLRSEAFRMLETRSLSIRAIGWLFVTLSVLLFITYTRRDVPTDQFFPMVAACGVLLVGGVLLVAVAHLLVGLRLMAMPADPEAQAVA